jgi:hypothetical protein
MKKRLTYSLMRHFISSDIGGWQEYYSLSRKVKNLAKKSYKAWHSRPEEEKEKEAKGMRNKAFSTFAKTLGITDEELTKQINKSTNQ